MPGRWMNIMRERWLGISSVQTHFNSTYIHTYIHICILHARISIQAGSKLFHPILRKPHSLTRIPWPRNLRSSTICICVSIRIGVRIRCCRCCCRRRRHTRYGRTTTTTTNFEPNAHFRRPYPWSRSRRDSGWGDWCAGWLGCCQRLLFLLLCGCGRHVPW